MSPLLEELLDPAQAVWVRARVPAPVVVQDMSWELMASTVLDVRDGEREIIVKAGDATNHHIEREIDAHEGWTAALARTGHAAVLIDADRGLRVMLLERLPGTLVEGTQAEHDVDVHRQAGALLARLHGQEQRTDARHESRGNERALRWLEGEHPVAAATARCARRLLLDDPAPPVTTVPAHGDWQPRNWLIDAAVVRIIDWGRFAFRPAATDLARLSAQQWQGRSDLEGAFLDGYGGDPRDPERWRMAALREAVGTACWAHRVGDEAFEAQGHRMLADALSMF